MSVSFIGYDSKTPHPRVPDLLPGNRIALDPTAWPEGCLNWANGNARIMLTLLGLFEGELMGSTTIPMARRAIMRAKATFDRKAPSLVRPEVSEPGFLSFGADLPSIERRLNNFGRFIEDIAAKGATHVTWG